MLRRPKGSTRPSTVSVVSVDITQMAMRIRESNPTLSYVVARECAIAVRAEERLRGSYVPKHRIRAIIESVLLLHEGGDTTDNVQAVERTTSTKRSQSAMLNTAEKSSKKTQIQVVPSEDGHVSLTDASIEELEATLKAKRLNQPAKVEVYSRKKKDGSYGGQFVRILSPTKSFSPILMPIANAVIVVKNALGIHAALKDAGAIE